MKQQKPEQATGASMIADTSPLLGLSRRIPAGFRQNFLWDAASALLIGVFNAITWSFAPVVARRLGASTFLISLVTAAQFAGSICSFLAAHYLQDKRKMPYMVWAWTISRALFLVIAFVTTPLPFVLIIVAFWIVVALPVPGYAEVMRKIYPDAYRGRAMAYVRVVMTATMTVLTPVAGILLDRVGYQILFPVAAIFGILSSLAFGRITFAETIISPPRPLSNLWRVLSEDRRYLSYQIAFFVYGFGNLMVVPLFPIFLVDEMRLSYGEVGLLGMINAIFWMLAYVLWGRSVDRRGSFWTLEVNFILTIFVPLGFFLAWDMKLLAVAYVFNGLTTAGIDLGWINGIMEIADRERVGDYTALHTFFVGVRGMLGPFLGAFLASTPAVGLRGAFLLSAVLIFAGWLLFRRLPRPAR
jgi:DHA1 family inner membrane transport protein